MSSDSAAKKLYSVEIKPDSSGADKTQEAEIEPPHLPGNYSARTNTKWIVNESEVGHVVSSDKLKSLDHDEIHEAESPFKVAPGQLYSTESGRLFHAGKLLICLAGLPGRGKTHLSVSLTRYLRWLGVSTQVFHFDDFRREYLHSKEISPKFFNQRPSDEDISKMKETLIEKCLEKVEEFLKHDKGQVAIYDAINGVVNARLELQERFKKINVKVLYIESLIDNEELLHNSLKEGTKSPDYRDWDPIKAKEDFNRRIEEASAFYEEINEVDKSESQKLSYIKSINFGERLVLNKSQYGYLINRMTFFLLNTRIKKGSIFFARCGDTDNHRNLLYKSDPSLSEKGKKHSVLLQKTLVDYLVKNGAKLENIANDLVIWTSTRTRTVETGEIFTQNYGIEVTHRPELTQLHPGNIDGLPKNQIEEKFPIEYQQFKKDPYHVRFPRGESYHDLAVRLEPLILEMERNTKNILFIGHESVLRVLYGYLLNCSSNDIPYLKFPANEIIEVRYNAYANSSSRIEIKE